MGMGAAKRRSHKKGYMPLAEINVTPFVDVMLVLLVIFMITAPMLTVGVPVELPRTPAPAIPDSRTPVEITVQKTGKVFVQEKEVPLDNLVALLTAITEGNAEARIYIRGDAGLSYGQMMQVMGRVTDAGFKKVGLVALPPAGK